MEMLIDQIVSIFISRLKNKELRLNLSSMYSDRIVTMNLTVGCSLWLNRECTVPTNRISLSLDDAMPWLPFVS